jgi:hypothetical protein
MRHQERITLQDNLISAAVKLAEGNPGAVTALLELAKQNERIDPDCAFGPVGPLFQLDTLGIYGSRIWMLYKDVCGQNVLYTLAVLRAVQLGIVPPFDLDAAINFPSEIGISLIWCQETLAEVQKRLPDFGRTQA